MKKATPQIERVREHSRTLVYQCLLERAGERLSRNDISWATGLSNPTVSTVLQEFSDLDLVAEVGHSSARGGRPAQLVRFNPQARCVFSVDLAEHGTRALIVDLTGKVLEREDGPVFREGDTERLFAWLAELHSRWAARFTVGRVAVALPGVVDHGRGMVFLAPALGWHNYPLAERLERHLGLPVTLENDVNALAFGEMRFGCSDTGSSALFLTITSGVGMGIVLDGHVFRGSNHAAGEVGYGWLPGKTRPAQTKIGESGPLELHLLGLVRRFSDGQKLNLDDPAAAEAFAEFSQDLAVTVQNAVCLLNPDRLVVAWLADPEGRLVQELRHLLDAPMPLDMSTARLGRDGAALGVAAMALDELVGVFCSAAGNGAA